MKKLIITKSSTTKTIAGKRGIQKSVKVETPPVTMLLPAHERAARQRRLLAERPRATTKAVPHLQSAEPAARSTSVRHYLSL